MSSRLYDPSLFSKGGIFSTSSNTHCNQITSLPFLFKFMANHPFLHLQADEISHLFSYIIFKAEDFSSFAKLLMVWEWNKPFSEIKYVLEKMDWENLYKFHNSPIQVTFDQFEGFVDYCLRHYVEQALFYDSCKRLFRGENVGEHLSTLSVLSGTNYFPARFACIFFRAVFMPFEVGAIAIEMIHIVSDSSLRGKVEWILRFLEDMYSSRIEIDELLHVYKFCPNARDLQPLYKANGILYAETLCNSLCLETVQDPFTVPGSVLGRSLKLQHIWSAKCQYCCLQLILFKILLSAILY